MGTWKPIYISLENHCNELICFINDGRTILLSIQEITIQVDSRIPKKSYRISGWVEDGL